MSGTNFGSKLNFRNCRLPYMRALMLQYKFVTKKHDPLEVFLTWGEFMRDSEVVKLKSGTVALEDILKQMSEKDLAALRQRVWRKLEDR